MDFNLNMFAGSTMKMERLRRDFEVHLIKPMLNVIPKEIFIRKHSIPPLLDYSLPAPECWWECWPKLTWEDGKKIKSNINPQTINLGK